MDGVNRKITFILHYFVVKEINKESYVKHQQLSDTHCYTLHFAKIFEWANPFLKSVICCLNLIILHLINRAIVDTGVLYTFSPRTLKLCKLR